MKEDKVHAGIDVSAKTLSWCVKARQGEFTNDSKGHDKLVKKFRALRVTHVCLEPTGSYSLDVALALSEAGFAVMVANPRAVRHFAEALIERSKNDSLDARCLAEFCARMPFQKWTPPTETSLALRGLARRIEAIKDLLVQEKNRLHACSAGKTHSQFIIKDIKDNISQLTKRVKRLEMEACKIVKADTILGRKFELLVSVPGIGQASALALLPELIALPDDMNVRQWVAAAGLDPRQRSSGSSIHGKPRISKTGNARIRKALFLPTLTALRYVPAVKQRALSLKTKLNSPLTGMQAVVALMRKLLHAIFGMFRTNSKFDIHKLFPAA